MYQLRRLSALALSLAMTSLLFSPFPAAAAQEDNMPLPLSSASALLMEKETGTILLQQNAHQKLEPASVTKVMTLLLVMEAVDSGRLSLDESVPVSAHAAGMGGSQVYLKEGERLSVSDLIKCVAVVSGNDCAVALAERLSGSESAFVDQMNQKAQALGMEDTHFVNCTGLPAPATSPLPTTSPSCPASSCFTTRTSGNTPPSGPTPSETVPSASPIPTA